MLLVFVSFLTVKKSLINDLKQLKCDAEQHACMLNMLAYQSCAGGLVEIRHDMKGKIYDPVSGSL